MPIFAYFSSFDLCNLARKETENLRQEKEELKEDFEKAQHQTQRKQEEFQQDFEDYQAETDSKFKTQQAKYKQDLEEAQIGIFFWFFLWETLETFLFWFFFVGCRLPDFKGKK